jgi:hypothetical protein
MRIWHKFSITLMFVFCIGFLLPTIAAAAPPAGVGFGINRVSLKASPDGIKHLNELKNTEISLGKLIREVFPEAIPSIPIESLKKMDQTSMVWPQNNANESAKEEITVTARGLTHMSELVSQRPNLNFDSYTVATDTMPYMMVVSYLYKYQSDEYVDAAFDSAENTQLVWASESYAPPSGLGLFQTKGLHWGDYPSGHDPEDYYETTQSIVLGV